MSDESPPKGRPLIVIEMEKLEALMRYDPTCEDAAAYFKCSVDTITRRISEETGLTYPEFKERHMAGTRLSLVQKALKLAEQGEPTMLKACLKRFCGWEKGEAGVQVNVQNNVNQTVNIEPLDLEERIKQLKGEE